MLISGIIGAAAHVVDPSPLRRSRRLHASRYFHPRRSGPAMTERELYDSLNALFSEIFLREDIALLAATTAADIDGWDSFKQIEIVMAVEERFGIRLQTRISTASRKSAIL
jgi:acyl carrier protein